MLLIMIVRMILCETASRQQRIKIMIRIMSRNI
jgi:hypothetical protein